MLRSAWGSTRHFDPSPPGPWRSRRGVHEMPNTVFRFGGFPHVFGCTLKQSVHREGVFPVRGNGVEIQVQGDPSIKAQVSHGIGSTLEELGLAGGIDPAAVFSQNGPLGCAVESGR